MKTTLIGGGGVLHVTKSNAVFYGAIYDNCYFVRENFYIINSSFHL